MDIKLSEFIDIISKFNNIRNYIFVDGDQYIKFEDMKWIFSDNTEPNYLMFITKNPISASKNHKRSFNLNRMFHIITSAAYKDAADFCISAQMYMLYTYLKINNIKDSTYSIVTNDHFAFNIKFDFQNIGQEVIIIDPKTNRLDLYLISLMEDNVLSKDAIEVKKVITSKNNCCDENIKCLQNIDSNSINNEIERLANYNMVPNKITVCRSIPRDIKLSMIRNYLKDSYFHKILMYVTDDGLFLSKLGNILPLRKEDKMILRVKSWHELFTIYKYLIEKELQISINDSKMKIMHKTFENLEYISINDFTNEQLMKYWQYYWEDSVDEFCLLYNIKYDVFASWVVGRKMDNSICSLAVKQYIIENKSYYL